MENFVLHFRNASRAHAEDLLATHDATRDENRWIVEKGSENIAVWIDVFKGSDSLSEYEPDEKTELLESLGGKPSITLSLHYRRNVQSEAHAMVLMTRFLSDERGIVDDNHGSLLNRSELCERLHQFRAEAAHPVYRRSLWERITQWFQ